MKLKNYVHAKDLEKYYNNVVLGKILPPAKKKKDKKIWLIAAGAITLALGIVAYFLLRDDEDFYADDFFFDDDDLYFDDEEFEDELETEDEFEM